jgi:hypothetical protein
LRFDNVPFRAGLILLESDFQSWDIIPTQVPNYWFKVNPSPPSKSDRIPWQPRDLH